MLNITEAVVRNGQITPLENIEIPDGTKALVTLLVEENEFWRSASESSLDEIWNNEQDYVYTELLTR